MESSEDEDKEEEDDGDVALDEVESVEEDVLPRQRLEIDNKVSTQNATLVCPSELS